MRCSPTSASVSFTPAWRSSIWMRAAISRSGTAHARYCLVFNGEIYNFRELRTELEADGVAFRTTSDTEVLLESIIHRGLDAMLPRLEGMFAFALYDTHEGSLTLARDRFGIKPLYVYDCDDAFAFASEIRALRPWIRFEPDVLSISSYLQGFGGPTSGHSFYRERGDRTAGHRRRRHARTTRLLSPILAGTGFLATR